MSNDDYSAMGISQGFEASTDEASRALADLGADQIAIRTVASPQRWFLVVDSIVIGSIVAVFAIPDSGQWWRIGILFALDVAIFTAMLWRKRHCSVRMDPFALFTPKRQGFFPVVIWIVVAVAILVGALFSHSYFPWWAYICGGLVVGSLTYVIMSRAWNSWARTPA